MATPPKDPNKPRFSVVDNATPSETATPQAKRRTQVKTPKDIQTGMTLKQEAFCQGIARQGLSYSEAYRQAFVTDNMTDGSIWTTASNLRKSPKVAARIESIVAEIKGESSAQRATRADRVLKTLEDLMVNAKSETARLRAADMLGKSIALWKSDGESDDEAASISELEGQIERLLNRGKAS